MSDNIHTAASEFSVIVPEVWSAKAYDVLLAKLPFNGSVDTSYQGDIADLGDTVNIHTIPEFDEADELQEGAKANAQSVTVTSQQLVINKRIVKDFIVTKKAQLQSLPVMDKLRDHAAYSIMKKVQSLIIATISPSASAPDHQIPYDSGSTLALADILEAKELLDLQDVPDEMRKGLVGASQNNDLFNITGFTSRDFIPSGSPITSGAFSTPFLGFEIDWTSELSSTSYFFHPSFLTIAFQENMSTSVYDLGLEGKRAARVNTDLLMGLKQLDSKRVVSIS